MIEIQKDDGLTWVTLNNPPLNILNIALLEDLSQRLSELSEDDGMGALILQGKGKCFSAGASVDEHQREMVQKLIRLLHQVAHQLWTFPALVVACLHNHCLGGGLELALAADWIMADPGAQLGQPEIKLAFFPPLSSALLPSILGTFNAFELISTGRTLSAEEAHAKGLVSRIVPKENWEEDLSKLKKLSRPVLRLTKKVMLLQKPWPEKVLEKNERLFLEDLYKLEDVEEGIRAFMEKRAPQWKHR